MKNVVIYARVSSKEQEKEGYSIPAQIKLLKEYADNKDFNVIRIFSESETAKKAGRKSFNEMLDFLKKEKINTILVEKTDRLYRNFKDYVTLDEYDLEVHLVKEGTVLSKDSKSHEKLVHGFKVLMAKNYIDNLSEEVKKGLKEKVSEGIFPHKAPAGYINTQNQNGKRIIEVDDTTAPFVRKLFELYASGVYSIEKLRKMLYEEGFNRKGKPYSKSRLLFILKDIFYIGKFRYNGVIYDGIHKPIIDVDLFNQVQKMFNVSKSRTHDVEFAYSGLLRCEKCGCQLTAELKKGKYIYYHCTGKRGGTCKSDYISESKLDKIFLDLIDKIPQPSKEILDEINSAVKEMHGLKCDYEDTSIKELEKQAERLRIRLDNLYQDKCDGIISFEEWEEKHNKWYFEREKTLQKLISMNNASKNFEEGSNLLINFLQFAHSKFLSSKPKEKQAILKMLGSNFSYGNKKVSVVLTSVFDLLINNQFVQYGGGSGTKLELLDFRKFVMKFYNSFDSEIVAHLKSINVILNFYEKSA